MKNKIIFLLLSVFFGTAWLILETSQPVSAQSDRVNKEQEEEEIPTRSYTGLGGNIGLGGETTALSDGGFSLLGRTALTKNVSLHSSTIFGDDNVSAFALTFGIPIYRSSTSELELAYPFVGGGIAIEDFAGDFDVDGLVTTGVDIPILKRLTATARLNLGFAENDTDVGLLLGVGYNFSIFELF